MASDKLFYFLFHSNPDLILRWLEDLPADAGGYSFSAPSPLLQPRDGQAPITPLARVLSLLLEPESQVRRISDALHQQAFTHSVAAEVLPLIPEICTIGGITLEDLSQSKA